MKQMTVQIFELTAAALVVLFCLSVFLGQKEEAKIGAMVHQIAVKSQGIEPVSENGQRLQNLTEMPLPEVKIYGRAYETGERIDVFSAVEVKIADGTWSLVREAKDYTMEVLEIYDQKGTKLWKDAVHNWEQDSDEIIAAASYESKTGQLCFYQSGNYTLKMKVTGPYGRTAVKLFHIPVETK